MRRTVCNFLVLLNEGEICFLYKGIQSSKTAYVGVKREITKFCNKLSMKVDLLVEIGKNVTLATNLIFTKLKKL